MCIIKKNLLFLLFLGTSFSLVMAQVQYYRGSYNQVIFGDMINDLEKSCDLRFYYHPELDSMEVTFSYAENTLHGLLTSMCETINLHFLVERPGVIILTRNDQIKPHLDFLIFEKPSYQYNGDEIARISEPIDSANQIEFLDDISSNGDVLKIGNENEISGTTATLSGLIVERSTGESLIGASIYIEDPFLGAVTDESGYYTLNLPIGRHILHVRYAGMKEIAKEIIVWGDGATNFEMNENIISLQEIIITSEQSILENLKIGHLRISAQDIKEIPSIFGEADIMKIALTLPGVQTVGEGAAGFNVRGGSADQNLILLNQIPIYNAQHLFGFFSAINSDVVSSANLFKSGISAKYGGRLSSVFDIALRDGNKKKFSMNGGISPITGKLTFEGPIKKDTSSYIVGIRSTYSDWILNRLSNPGLRNSEGAFSDVVFKMNSRKSGKNDINISAYHSRDQFRFNSDSLYQYANTNAAIQWRHNISNRMNMSSTVSWVNYQFTLSSSLNQLSAFQLDYDLSHVSGDLHFNYFAENDLKVDFGFSSKFLSLKPGSKIPLANSSLIETIYLETEKGIESVLFVGSEFDINSRVSLYGGIRLSSFVRLGPGQSYLYASDLPRSLSSVTDTLFYPNNKAMESFLFPEIRLAGRYQLAQDISLKFSYDRMIQYLHVLSNTVAISPIDTWRLSARYLPPQEGSQFSAGLYKTFLGTSWEMSLETYYKNVNNILEYKPGASLLLNELLETDVILANGRSFGLELLLKKRSGKFNGWLSYTYARTFLRTNEAHPDEVINGGDFYPANFDKPHSVAFVTNYKFNRRVNFSINIDYSSGRPVTLPAAKYSLKGQPLLFYTDRNAYRVPDYFRVDLAFNFSGNHKVNKKIHGSWTFSIYNLSNRANAYSIFYENEHGKINGYKLSIFRYAIPSLTYNFLLK